MPGIGPFAHGSNPLVKILVPAVGGKAGRSFYDTVVESTTTVISYTEGGPYYELATVKSVTSIPVGEYEFLHPTGYWGPFDTESRIIV